MVVRHGREYAKLGVQVCVNSHDGRHVTAPVAVIGRRPDRDHGFFWEVKLGEQLMSATDAMLGLPFVGD